MQAVGLGLDERTRAQHRARLHRQLNGYEVHLIAWHSTSAIGHVGLVLPSDRSPRHVAEFEDAGTVNDLFVRREHRRRGVGRELMRALEREASRLRINRLALDAGVGAGANAARELYRSMGWEEVPDTLHVLSSSIPDDDGGHHPWLAILTTWRKELTDQASRRASSSRPRRNLRS